MSVPAFNKLFLSLQFYKQSGWGNGDPLALYLFIIYAEILSIFIKKNKNTCIIDILINKKEHEISQYADDTCLALDGSPKFLFEALKSFSGLQ